MKFFNILTAFVALNYSLNGTADDRPNIIVIMADDIGFECLNCYGGKEYETPNLDKLAASGIKFNHAHSQPICTPSRVQIMTGIYNNRNYIEFGLLDPKAHTFGHAMKDAGYSTMVAGKWQLKGGFEGPGNLGFDNYCLWQLTRRPSRYPNPGLEIDGEEKDFKEGQFGPDVVTDYINAHITEKKSEDAPFFIYYPMIAPHWPFVPTPDHPDWDPTMWADKKSEPGGYKDDKYWTAMVKHTDKMVGKIMNHLEKEGLRENTLIMWTGDNGTYESVTTEINGMKYKGGKSYSTDNGTHVGFIASWPAQIKAGQVLDDLVDFSDVFPTVTELGKAKTPDNLDGTSLAPLFRGEKREKPYIYCWYERNGVREKAKQWTRDQKYKLYSTGKFFDTTADLYERSPLDVATLDESGKVAHEKLKTALDEHVAITKERDPFQEEKKSPRKKQNGPKPANEKKKKQTEKKKAA